VLGWSNRLSGRTSSGQQPFEPHLTIVVRLVFDRQVCVVQHNLFS